MSLKNNFFFRFEVVIFKSCCRTFDVRSGMQNRRKMPTEMKELIQEPIELTINNISFMYGGKQSRTSLFCFPTRKTINGSLSIAFFSMMHSSIFFRYFFYKVEGISSLSIKFQYRIIGFFSKWYTVDSPGAVKNQGPCYRVDLPCCFISIHTITQFLLFVK